MAERFKWWLAYQLNRLSGQCWADLVYWVLRSPKDDPGLRAALPWRPINAMCRFDAAECGRCYCGKLAAEAGTDG
jgi:hypothetical protein